MEEIDDKLEKDENKKSIEKKDSKLKIILKEIGEWIICFIIAYILYLILNYFIGTISGVKQVSMLPTAKEGERVLIQRPTIFKKELKYGDIITFEAPIDYDETSTSKNDDNIADYVEYTGINSFIYNFVGIGKTSYIKRVIGVAGDHIVIDDDGFVYKNDVLLEEDYIKDGFTNQNGEYVDVVVPENTVFVMGDNRLMSKDSRSFGCIPISKVNGYVIIRLWPFNKIGKL